MKCFLASIFVILNLGSRIIAQDNLFNNYRLLCYYDAESIKRTNFTFQFLPRHIDPTLCSHIVAAYAILDEHSYTVQSPKVLRFMDMKKDGNDHILTSLKKRNPSLRIILGIGGYADSRTTSDKYSFMARDKNNRAKFIASVIEYLKKYNFDAVSLEWQDPTWDGYADDRTNYVTLLGELKQALTYDNRNYELYMSFSPGHPDGYDLKAIEPHIDFINVMSFNYVTFESDPKLVGHHSAFRQMPKEKLVRRSSSATRSVYKTMNYLLNNLKLDPKKLILGIPAYGTTFGLADSSKYKPLAKFITEGQRSVTRRKGILAYFEICPTIGYLPVHHCNYWSAPFTVGDMRNTWVGYEDEKSIKQKVMYMKHLELAGVLFYTMDMDDFLGSCSRTKFPLLKAIKSNMMISNKRVYGGTQTSEELKSIGRKIRDDLIDRINSVGPKSTVVGDKDNLRNVIRDQHRPVSKNFCEPEI